MMLRTHPKTGACSISRDELHAIFEYMVGNMPDSPNKFTSLLKHHRLRTMKVWCDDKAVYGIRTVWKDVDQFETYVAQHFAPPRPAKVAAAKTVKGR